MLAPRTLYSLDLAVRCRGVECYCLALGCLPEAHGVKAWSPVHGIMNFSLLPPPYSRVSATAFFLESWPKLKLFCLRTLCSRMENCRHGTSTVLMIHSVTWRWLHDSWMYTSFLVTFGVSPPPTLVPVIIHPYLYLTSIHSSPAFTFRMSSTVKANIASSILSSVRPPRCHVLLLFTGLL